MPRYDVVCPNGHEQLDIVHSAKDPHPTCPECGEATATLWRTFGAGIAGDDIPGGFVPDHGVGIAGKKFYSKTELKRAANENGWTIAGDTPKPYRVQWSGRQKTQGGLPVKE